MLTELSSLLINMIMLHKSCNVLAYLELFFFFNGLVCMKVATFDFLRFLLS